MLKVDRVFCGRHIYQEVPLLSVIQVFGLTPLEGEISIQGSKNAVLPLAAAALLHRGIPVLTNVPVIRDVACMVDILEYL